MQARQESKFQTSVHKVLQTPLEHYIHGEDGGFSHSPSWNEATCEPSNWCNPLSENTLSTARTSPLLKVMADQFGCQSAGTKSK